MIMPFLLLFVAGDLQVRSDSGCVAADIVTEALRDDVDVAEDVWVSVFPQPSTTEPYLLVLDAQLLHAEALHRSLGLRTVECDDVTELVALWLRLHRGRAGATTGNSKPPTTDDGASSSSPAAVPKRTRPAGHQTPPPLTAPGPNASNNGGAAPTVLVSGAIGLGSLGPTLSVDAAVLWSPGILVAVGSQVGVEDTRDLGLTLDAGLVSSIGDLDVQLRVGAWAGLAAGFVVEQEVVGNCDAPSIIETAHPTQQLAVGPRFAARITYHWLFLEGATAWRFPADATLQATVSAGIQISFAP